jgi:SAM-dependent methyltransferase
MMDGGQNGIDGDEFPADPILSRYIPELVADLWALGASPERYVESLSALGLRGERVRVLDLGCGKGAAAVTIAGELGVCVTGVDLNERFLAVAEAKAREYGVSRRCRFRRGDMRAFVRTARGFDAAVYASVGTALGSDFTEIVGLLRSCVNSGGYMVIDDGCLKDSAPADTVYRHYRPHDETVRMLTAHGDILVRELHIPDEEKASLNRRYIDALVAGARRVTAEHPDLGEKVERFIESQRNECRRIEQDLSGMVWILERGAR